MSNKKSGSLSARSAILLMAAVSVARGSSFLFSQQLLETIEPLNLLGIRSLIAFAVLSTDAFLRKESSRGSQRGSWKS